jgi:hypothetical protein
LLIEGGFFRLAADELVGGHAAADQQREEGKDPGLHFSNHRAGRAGPQLGGPDSRKASVPA